MEAPAIIRQPAVAGMFYPADPERLAGDVDRMLAGVPDPPSRARPLMLMSPHAGYPFSGEIAAAGFRWLREHPLQTIVMVGPSHVEYFDFTSVWTGDAYETPLGRVAVDADMGRRIAGHANTIRESDSGHVQPHLGRGEHGLEVQLPFLQRIHPEARLVPVVMGDQSWQHCEALGEALASECGPEDVILASSDLSHFYDSQRAEALDLAFLDALSTLCAEDVYQAVSEGRCEACGAGPVIASLIATRGAAEREYQLLSRRNSGDVTGERSSVVGYAAAVVHA